MSEIDAEKAITSGLDLEAQTLTLGGKKYRYQIHDPVNWATQVKSGSYHNVPVPRLTWRPVGHSEPIKDLALLDDLNNAYMNASMYEGLRSQAGDLLRKYGRKARGAAR